MHNFVAIPCGNIQHGDLLRPLIDPNRGYSVFVHIILARVLGTAPPSQHRSTRSVTQGKVLQLTFVGLVKGATSWSDKLTRVPFLKCALVSTFRRINWNGCRRTSWSVYYTDEARLTRTLRSFQSLSRRPSEGGVGMESMAGGMWQGKQLHSEARTS